MRLSAVVIVLWTAFAPMSCGVLREKMFFLQKTQGADNETILVVTWPGGDDEMDAGCEVFRDLELIQEVMKSSGDNIIQKSTDGEIQQLLKDCTEISLRRRRRKRQADLSSLEERGAWKFWKQDSDRKPPGSNNRGGRQRQMNSTRNNEGSENGSQRNGTGRRIDDSRNASNNSLSTTPMTTPSGETTTEVPSSTEGYSGLPVIFLGTKWCGAGDIAKNYDDLGVHEDTDRCCRAHDLCNDTLAPGETKYNLTNDSRFTKLSCKCDDDFYDCLHNVDSVVSNSIGNFFFNVLGRECYDVDYPPTSTCKNYRSFLKIKCDEYEKNTSSPKVYQWVSPKRYRKLPVPGPLSITLPI